MTESQPPLRDSYEGLIDRARRTVRTGSMEDAIALYRRLVEKLSRLSTRVLDRRPELLDLQRQARLELTSLLQLEGRLAEAIEVEGILLETHPDEADVWRTDLAILRVAKGEIEEGLAELQMLAEQEPGNPRPWVVLGREARIEGRLSKSQIAINQALKAASGDDHPEVLAEIHYQRFQLFKEMGQLDDAAAAWEQGLKCDARTGSTIREVYTMLTDAGRYSEARRYVNRDDNALQAGFQRGLLAHLVGDTTAAKQEWQKVADSDPATFEQGHDAWVESVLRLGDPVPALEWLQASLARYGTPRLLVLSGIAWAMHKDQELASALFQQAVNLLRHSRPPKKKLDSADWRLLDSLVDDDEMKQALKPYFAVVETIWG